MNTADTFKMKMLADRQCVAVSAAVLAADKPSLRRLGQGAFNEYANRLSSLMRESIVESDDFGNDFEDVSAEVTSPMRYAHHLINDCGVAVISAQDEEDGIHIKPVEVKFNDRRLVSNIGAYCADGNLETFAARAETQVKSTANELVKANAEARYKAGFDVKITRTGADRCCDWCAERIGSWTIDNAPDGVFGCHDNCKCTVEYRNSKGVTSRRTGRVGSFVEVDYKPHVGVVQNGENQPHGLTNSAVRGKILVDVSGELKIATWISQFMSDEEKQQIINRGVNEKKPIFSYNMVEDSRKNHAMEYLEKIKKEPFTFDVLAHGSKISMDFFSLGKGEGVKGDLDPYLLSEILKQRSDYQEFLAECKQANVSPTIRLLSCSTGDNINDGDCFAKRLHEIMGVTVKAPNDVLRVYSDGSFFVGQVGDGYMEVFDS